MKHKDLHNVKMLDLTPLNCLKSLVLEGCNTNELVSGVEVRGLGTLKSLGYLSWTDHYISSASMEDIACLTSLKYLGLSCIGCEKLLDLSNLKLLRGVQLDIREGKPSELSGFSSKMTKLKRLRPKFNKYYIHEVTYTQPYGDVCHGIPNLMALEELEIEGAVNVGEVFYLQMLTNLRRLTISGCESIKELQGFDDLAEHPGRSAVSLEELTIEECPNLRKLPHIGKLTNLRILNIRFCPVQSLAGLGELVALEVLEARHCSQLSEIPDLHQLSNLKRLDLRRCRLRTVRGLDGLRRCPLRTVRGLDGLRRCPLRTVRGLDGLEALDDLTVRECVELVALPGLCRVRGLKVLDITECSSLKPLPYLESLHNLRVLMGDWQVVIEPHKLPAQLEELTIEGRCLMERFKMLNPKISRSRLPGVNSLCLKGCNFRAVSCLINRTALRELDIKWCHGLIRLHDLPHLQTLRIYDIHMVIHMIDMGFLPELELLELWHLAVTELPDLSSCCPKLSRLSVIACKKLRSLTSSAPLIALTSLEVGTCGSLRELPDLTLFTKLEHVGVWECGIRLRTPKDSSSHFPSSSWPNVEWEAVP